MTMKISNILFSAVGICLFTSTTLASNVADSDIVTFTANATAKSAEVNQNFTKLKEANNDNDARIITNTTAIGTKQARVTGACSSGQAIKEVGADGTVVCEDLLTAIKAADGSGSGLDADMLDGRHSNEIIRVTGLNKGAVNTSTSPTSAALFSVTAPTNGYLLLSFSFSCTSFSGTANTIWHVGLQVDGVAVSTWEAFLSFPKVAITTGVYTTGGGTQLATVTAGNHTVQYIATRASGDGSLDCDTSAHSIFSPYNNVGTSP
jgi:hypothetical protein